MVKPMRLTVAHHGRGVMRVAPAVTERIIAETGAVAVADDKGAFQ